MASTIQIKNSTTSGNSPSSLTTGELAINVVDGNFFYGSASAVKQDFAIGNLTSSNVAVSGNLSIEGSGSTLFEVVGSEGQLFSITDNLSGSLFAVSDVSGLPILEVFSDDTVKIGTFNNEGLIVGGANVTASNNVDIQGTLSLPGFNDVSASLAAAVAGGDDLGNHTATQNLNMGTYAITNVGNVDGRDVSADGSKLDGIEAGADVTDTANVTAAGALMDSEVTNLAQVKAFDSSDYATAAQGALADTAIQPADTGSFSTATGVEDNADVTDATNVQAAGALMDSEVTDLDGIKSLTVPNNTTISTFGASLVDDTTAAAARTTLGVDAAGTDNSTDVTLVTTSHDYLSIAGQAITLGTIDISDDTNLVAGGGISLSGDTLSVAAGTGLNQGATGLSFDADGGTLTTNNADVDHILINDGGVFKRITKGNINVGDFNNDAGYTTNTGTVTSVGGTGTVDGLTLSGTVTTSGNLTLGGAISITTSSITDFPTEVSRSAAAAGFGASGGGGSGTVTEVTVGTGLDVTNGTTTPNITLDLTEITVGTGLDTTATGISLDLTEVGFAIGGGNRLITNDGDGTVTAEANLTFDGTTLNVDGKIDVDYSTTSGAIVDISNNTSAVMSADHYSLKVAGGQAIGTPGGQTKGYGGYFTAGNTNGTNPDTIALYAQGHEDGAPNSYAAIFSGSAGGVVGINTMEPTVELDVVGDISASNDVRIVNNLSLGAVADVEDRISSYRVAIMSNGFYSQNSLRYLTYNTTTETTSANTYISIIPAAANGKVISVTCWPQSSGGSSVLSFYVNGGTASATDTQTLTSGVPVQFTFSSGNTFSALDELAFSIDPTNTPNGLSFQIILEYDY
jgi:hypothetical protein